MGGKRRHAVDACSNDYDDVLVSRSDCYGVPRDGHEDTLPTIPAPLAGTAGPGPRLRTTPRIATWNSSNAGTNPLCHAARSRLGRHAAALGPRDSHMSLSWEGFHSSQQPRAGRGGLQPRGARQLDLVLGLRPLTINNTANAGNSPRGRRVHGHARPWAQRPRRASCGRHADHHGLRGPAGCESWTAPSRPRAAECRRAAWSAAT